MKKHLFLPHIDTAGFYDMEISEKPSKPSPLRKTRMFEFELPIAKGGFSHINGINYPIDTTHIICVKPNTLRYTQPPFKCHYIHFSLEEGELFDFLCNLPDIIPINDYSTVENLFFAMETHFRPQLHNTLLFYQSLLELISYLYNATKKVTPVCSIANDTKNYINKHFHENIDLSKIATAIGYHPTYLHRIFKKDFGITPLEYLTEKRIERAKYLLRFSDYTLNTIAELCGFNTQTYFQIVFKNKTNITPLQYRKEYYNRYNQEPFTP